MIKPLYLAHFVLLNPLLLRFQRLPSCSTRLACLYSKPQATDQAVGGPRRSCLHLAGEAEIQSPEEAEGEPRQLVEGAEEQGSPKSAAAAVGRQRLVGSTGSRQHSSGTHRMRRRDQPIRSTGHTVRCSLLRWMSQGLRDQWDWRRRQEIDAVGCCNRRILRHRHGSDHPGHPGGRSHRSRVGEGCP